MAEQGIGDLKVCPCGGAFEPLLQAGKPVTRWWPKGEVQAEVCSRCCHVRFPPPTEAELNDYYRNDYGSGSEVYYTYELDHEPGRIASRARIAIHLAETFHAGRTDPVILELGCAFGGAVSELRRLGRSAYGLDLNSRAIAEGRARGNSFLYDSSPDEFLGAVGVTADVIYSYHMLEHVRDLRAYLGSVASVLNEGGIAMFRVPNGAYLRAWLKGFETWDWFAFPDHLHMLTPVSAAALVRQCGFELVGLRSNACGETWESIVSWLPEAAARGNAAVALLEEAGCLSELEFVFRKTAGATAAGLAGLNTEAVEFAQRSEALEAEIKVRSRLLAQTILK
jgi:SAM-dependent methyltransferase